MVQHSSYFASFTVLLVFFFFLLACLKLVIWSQEKYEKLYEVLCMMCCSYWVTVGIRTRGLGFLRHFDIDKDFFLALPA